MGKNEAAKSAGVFAWHFPVMRFNLSGIFLAVFLAAKISAQIDPLAAALDRGDAEQKRTALAAIRNLRSADASRAAVTALRDPNILVRATAASSVVFLPPAEAALNLIPLLDDRDEFVRREAAYALGLVGDRSGVVPLLALLDREKAIEVKSAAIIGLGKIGDTAAVNRLLAVLRNKPRENDEFLRRSAARSIGQIARFVRTGLRSAVVTPQNFLPRQLKMLPVAIAAPTDEQKEALRPATAALLKVLDDSRESRDTRREAAFALGALGDAAALPALRSAIGAADYYLSEISREAVIKIEAARAP